MTIAATMTVWGAIRVLGNERQRRIDLVQAEADALAASVATQAAAADAIPVIPAAH